MQLLNSYFSEEVADEPNDESKSESFYISSYFNDSKDIIMDADGENGERLIWKEFEGSQILVNSDVWVHLSAFALILPYPLPLSYFMWLIEII